MRTILVLLVLALLLPSAASAQTADPSRAATARALFQEGVALARRGEYADASERFRRSEALHPAAPVAFNLASSLAHTGALVEASEILEQVLRDPSLTDVLRSATEHLRAELAPRLARLVVRIEGDDDVRVELDDTELTRAALGVPVPVDPGPHLVRARRGSDTVADAHVSVGEGERQEVVLTVAPPPMPQPEIPIAAIQPDPPAMRDDSPSPSHANRGDDGLWIGVGVGIAALVAGAVVTTVVLVTTPDAPTPTSGNAMPGVLTW